MKGSVLIGWNILNYQNSLVKSKSQHANQILNDEINSFISITTPVSCFLFFKNRKKGYGHAFI